MRQWKNGYRETALNSQKDKQKLPKIQIQNTKEVQNVQYSFSI